VRAPYLPTDRVDRVSAPGVDSNRGAKPASKRELGIVDIDGGNIEAHRHRVLHSHVAEAADARDHHPVARPRIGDLEPLINSDTRAQHRCHLDEAHFCRQMANEIRIGDDIFGKAAVYRISGVLLRPA
jgi:hypothetical protein